MSTSALQFTLMNFHRDGGRRNNIEALLLGQQTILSNQTEQRVVLTSQGATFHAIYMSIEGLRRVGQEQSTRRGRLRQIGAASVLDHARTSVTDAIKSVEKPVVPSVSLF